MTNRSTAHATFAIERVFTSPPAKVFAAFADADTKRRWFSGPPGWDQTVYELDFRVGGREISRVGPPGGEVHSYEAQYEDIVPDERIVFSYQMSMDENRISVSVTTVELAAAGSGTKMVFTEQDVFLDGYDDANQREQGSRFLLEALAAVVDG